MKRVLVYEAHFNRGARLRSAGNQLRIAEHGRGANNAGRKWSEENRCKNCGDSGDREFDLPGDRHPTALGDGCGQRKR